MECQNRASRPLPNQHNLWSFFSTQDIVNLWEIGRLQHPLDRALTILAHACPEMERSSLATLTIGQRDRLLFELREQMFGGKLDAFVKCPQCCEHLEFSLHSADILTLSETQPSNPGQSFDIIEEGLTLMFRLPDSNDLAIVAQSAAPDTARVMLMERCVIEASIEGNKVFAHELPDTFLSRLATRMSECDPGADILLNLACPSCNTRWQQSFDIVSFFWTEITAQAKRLLREVHALARVYGWREADILAMSPARRNYYLELVEG